MNLPADFITKYQNLLGDEAEDFLNSFDQPSNSGFRINPLKDGRPVETIKKATGKVPYVPGGYYGKVDGKSLDHVTGWVYSQEPSAMYVGEVVDPQPGEKVLDLCAAPGGKSTHLIAKMKDQGLLVANEIFTKRAKILASNLERWGSKNTVVTNESPDELVHHFPQFFDRILIDAPCSGEGMFRKEPAGIEYWNKDYPAECANRQRKILESAMEMLRPGGTLVYSTCTFAPEEDEQNVAWLLKNYPDLEMVNIKKYSGMDNGRPDWAGGNQELQKAVRMFPHHINGEGHFIAKLRSTSNEKIINHPRKKSKKRKRRSQYKVSREHQKLFVDWQEAVLPDTKFNDLIEFGDQLYALPDIKISYDGLDTITPGLHLGTLKKKRFVPALALAFAIDPTEVKQKLELAESQWRRYTHGDTLTIEADKPNGWYLLVIGGHTIGFGKLVGKTIKNFFPKGLRF